MLTAPLRHRGMSLIELMIGVALVGIIMMVAVPNFSTAMQNRQIRTAADSIQTGLQFAKTEALRRNRNVNFVLVDTGSSWTVGCTTEDTGTTDGEVNCPALIQSYTAQEGSRNASVAPSEHIATPAGGAASPAKFTNTLTFTPLGRVDVSTLTGGNVALFTVTNPTGGTCASASGEMRCLNVVVTSSGQVRMCDPAVASTDPRTC